jgi:hypothetical protein
MLSGTSNRPNLCYNCGKTGHLRARCPQLDALKCFRCGKIGHTAHSCPGSASAQGENGGCRWCGELGHRIHNCPGKRAAVVAKTAPATGKAEEAQKLEDVRGCGYCGQLGHRQHKCPGKGEVGGRSNSKKSEDVGNEKGVEIGIAVEPETKAILKQAVVDATSNQLAKQMVTMRTKLQDEATQVLGKQLVSIRSEMREEAARELDARITTIRACIDDEVASQVAKAVKTLGEQQEEKNKQQQQQYEEKEKRWVWEQDRLQGEIKRLEGRLDSIMLAASQNQVRFCPLFLPGPTTYSYNPVCLPFVEVLHFLPRYKQFILPRSIGSCAAL